MSHYEQLDRARIFGEEIQGAAVAGYRPHVEIGVALLPLGETAVKLGLGEPVAVGDSMAVVDVGEP